MDQFPIPIPFIIALGLLTVDIAGSEAGIVMGTALTIRIIAFVTISPVMSALVNRLPRTAVLVGSFAATDSTSASST